MDQFTRDAALDVRTRAHIRNTARRLAGRGGVPGMDAEDIEQDLFLDLWRRRGSFDPERASFATFADRIIAHRVATLTSPTARLRAERRQVCIDEPLEDDLGQTLADVLADPMAPGELDHGLALDLRCFVAGLTPALQRCCEILLAPNLRAATVQAGVHHSSLYENARRLRRQAEAAGLKEYVAPSRHFRRHAGRCLA